MLKKYLKAQFEDGSENNAIEVRVTYSLGNGRTKRGYYGSVTPVKVENRGQWSSVSYMMFSGGMTLLKEVAKASSKVAESFGLKDLDWLVKQIAKENKATLETVNGEWVEL